MYRRTKVGKIERTLIYGLINDIIRTMSITEKIMV